MFDSILGTSLTVSNFAVCILVALGLGLVVALLHMKSVKSNKNFITTLFILPALVTAVILLVNGNLGTSVAVVGAFSLVRFRSIPGNSREILDVFFAMAIGLAVGTGYIAFAVAFTVVLSIVFYIVDTTRIFTNESNEKILTVLIPEDLDYTDCFEELFRAYTDKYDLIKAKTVNMGSVFELTYSINLKKDINEKEFIDKLRVKNGNLKVSLTHPLINEKL
jgi:type IV secretory pathway VirB2 component (pilin)